MSETFDKEYEDEEELHETINDINWELRFTKNEERIEYLENLLKWLNELIELREKNKMKDFKEITELKDTVDLMLSDNFADRLKGEYAQLNIRLQGLDKFILSDKYHSLPNNQQELLSAQSRFMREYLSILSERMKDLNI